MTLQGQKGNSVTQNVCELEQCGHVERIYIYVYIYYYYFPNSLGLWLHISGLHNFHDEIILRKAA